MIRRLAPLVAAACMLLLPAAASAAPKAEKVPAKEPTPQATVKIEVEGLHGGSAPIWSTVPVSGTVSPYVPGEKVEVVFYFNGHRLVARNVAVQKGPGETGTFEDSVILRQNGKYAVSAHHKATPELGGDTTVRKSWRVSFPSLHPGECGKVVKGFKRELAKMGYVSGGGSCFNGRLGREVLAYRKVNDMDRNQQAGAALVKRVYAGRGGFHLKFPNAGEHAEVSIPKQVLVLAKNGKPFAIYPVSTGKSSTPTITGHYSVYRLEPGTNSHGMVYSDYWHNGYAIHGYAEVPNYPASHGCVRTFIADQPRIYEQLHLGEDVFVY
ncbi:MAG TPA: L,D-transpeptidase [Solirubrobacterales bacterium]|nr:L,D-transpeptidase [Solirubrobacterales bacterium]